MRTTDEHDSTARLDLALRTLAHHAAHQDSTGLPAVRAVRIGSRTLQVLPDDPTEAPSPPFTAGNAQGWWDLPARADLLNREQVGQVPAPYPALVTLGHAGDDALVLLNLTQLPALLLDGDPVHIAQVCTSLALEHAMSPWASDADILAIGFGKTLPHLLPHSHITHTRHPARALQDLTERLLEAHQHPDLPHRPCLILSATALDTDTVHQIADLIDNTRIVPLALIAPASTARALFPHAVILDAADSRPQHLDLIGADITLQRVDDTAYAQITAALACQPAATETTNDEPSPRTATGLSGRDVAHPSGHAARAEAASVETPGDDNARAGAPGQPPVPAPDTGSNDAVFAALLAATPEQPLRPRDTAIHRGPVGNHDGAASDTPSGSTPPQTHRSPAQQRDRTLTGDAAPAGIGDSHAPEIRVLGPVDVDGVPHTGHGPKTAQLAALLYFRPGRTADALCTDMDPTTPWTATTLNARLHQLRRALGNTPDGQPYVPRRNAGGDPYRLHPDIRCDWTTFQHLTHHAPPADENLRRLETALQLVRGRPFDGRPLPWAEPHHQEMTTSIVDVAHTVATRRTPPGPDHNLSLARQAIATALDVDPTAEKIYRAWMFTEHTAGNRSGLHMAISRLQQVNAGLGCPLQAETTRLIDELLHATEPNQAHHP
ncbi:bacterial transcriptional activator domain-containing protein [Streptomyces sp. NPDC054833]